MALAVLLAFALAAAPAGADAGIAEPPFPGSEADPALTAELGRALDLRWEHRAQEALALLDSIRARALDEKHLEIATRALHQRAEVLVSLGRQAEAGSSFHAAYQESERRGDYWAMGQAAHELGVLLAGSSGMTWYAKAEEAQRKAKDYAGLKATAIGLADRLATDHKVLEAEPHFAAAIEASEALADLSSVARTTKRLADLLLEEGEKSHDPKVVERGCAYLAKAYLAFQTAGKDPNQECSLRRAADLCGPYSQHEDLRVRSALHRSSATQLRERLRAATNGYPTEEDLLRAARAVSVCAGDLREMGDDEAGTAKLMRECRVLLMDALSARDGSRPLVELCAAEDVRDLCALCGLVTAP